jgi:malate synthase
VTVDVRAPVAPEHAGIVSRDALDFVAALQREFDARRRELLDRRLDRQARLDAGSRSRGLPSRR